MDYMTPVFLLSGCTDGWTVRSGAVDIFSVVLSAGTPSSAREHICRIEAGQIVAGLGSASLEASVGLIAVKLPGAEVSPGARMDSPAVDAWLVALTAGMSKQPPRHYLDAVPDTPLPFQPEQLFYAKREVAWAWEGNGELVWMPAQAALPELPFPLTPSIWMRADSAGEISFRSTADLIRSGRLDTALAGFYRAYLDYLHRRRTRQDEAERQRLELKAHTDDQRFGTALAGMAEVLAREDDVLPAKTGDTLLDACQMVMDASGLRTSLKDDVKASTGRIEHFALQANASLRRVALSGECWWREDAGPLLAFRQDGTPIALLPAGNRGYFMADAANGTRVRLDKEAAAGLADTAFMFFRNFPHRPIGMLDLMRFSLSGTAPDLRRIVAIGALGGLLGLFTPFATGLLVDSVIPNGQRNELLQLVLLLLTVIIGISAFELTRSIAMLRVNARMGNAAQAAIIDRLIHLPAAFFRDYSAGDLAQRAFGIDAILQLLTTTTQAALLGWIFGLFSYVYLFFINLQLALLATVLVATTLALTTALNLWRLKMERRMFKIQGNIASRVFQILGGIAKIRSSGAEKRAFSLWAGNFSAQKKLDLRGRSIGNVLMVFDAGFVVLSSLLLFGAVAFFMPQISTGDFLSFNTALAQFLVATSAMTSALTASLNVIPLYERAKPILDTLPEVNEAQNAPGELSGAINIDHVIFRYTPDGAAILNDVSINIKPGEFVAFVGPSGSGKSTLFRLLLGFEKPESGAIYYDAQDLDGLDVGAVRRQLGVVLQNGKLMPGDIFTNIVGSSSLTLDDAWEAARIAGLEDDIKSMPMGMHTVIAEGAGTISGGQKQRLMIARAIVKKPRILLFDEATSALDNRTQATVAQSIEHLNATRIVIAHRLSTVLKADRIFVIDAGRVVESGNYDELMKQNGAFAQLAKRQIL